MKKLNQFVLLAGIALVLAFSSGRAAAQGGGGGFGGFDPNQLYQMIVDGQRDSLAVTNDDDWKAISPKLLKVVQLQMQARTTGMGAMFGGMRGGPGGPGGQGGPGGPGGGGAARRMAGMLGGEVDPSETALQTALDNHAPVADVKAALAKVRAAREQKHQQVLKAQADLRELLTTRQEATLVSAGLLD